MKKIFSFRKFPEYNCMPMRYKVLLHIAAPIIYLGKGIESIGERILMRIQGGH